MVGKKPTMVEKVYAQIDALDDLTQEIYEAMKKEVNDSSPSTHAAELIDEAYNAAMRSTFTRHNAHRAGVVMQSKHIVLLASELSKVTSAVLMLNTRHGYHIRTDK